MTVHWKIMSRLGALTDMTEREKLALLVYAIHWDEEGKGANIKISTLASEMCCSVRTAQYAVSGLRKRGTLVPEGSIAGGGRSRTTYNLCEHLAVISEPSNGSNGHHPSSNGKRPGKVVSFPSRSPRPGSQTPPDDEPEYDPITERNLQRLRDNAAKKRAEQNNAEGGQL